MNLPVSPGRAAGVLPCAKSLARTGAKIIANPGARGARTLASLPVKGARIHANGTAKQRASLRVKGAWAQLVNPPVSFLPRLYMCISGSSMR